MVSLGVQRHRARWTRANVTPGRLTMPTRTRTQAAIIIRPRSLTCITAPREIITILSTTTTWRSPPPCPTWPATIWTRPAPTTWPPHRPTLTVTYCPIKSIRRWYSGPVVVVVVGRRESSIARKRQRSDRTIGVSTRRRIAPRSMVISIPMITIEMKSNERTNVRMDPRSRLSSLFFSFYLAFFSFFFRREFIIILRQFSRPDISSYIYVYIYMCIVCFREDFQRRYFNLCSDCIEYNTIFFCENLLFL